MKDGSVGFLRVWFRRSTVKRAVVVGLVVGTLLCLINQWQAIVLGVVPVDWLKVVLTYFVPYAVSSYSTAASLSASASAAELPENPQ